MPFRRKIRPRSEAERESQIMEYAVIRTGGKQYRVTEGQTLRVEALDGDPGSDVEFGEVLLARNGDSVVLDPEALAKIKVSARIVRHGRGKKIHILKFKRRKGFQRRQGHRQDFTEVRIASIA